MKSPPTYDQRFLNREALKNGVMNLIINGAIQYFMLRDEEKIPLTIDSISSNEVNVAGSSISLSIAISVILTIITYLLIKGQKISFIPKALWLTVRNAFFAFTTLTATAVLFHRLVGSVQVSLLFAVLIIGLISGIVAAIISHVTIQKCVINETFNSDLK